MSPDIMYNTIIHVQCWNNHKNIFTRDDRVVSSLYTYFILSCTSIYLTSKSLTVYFIHLFIFLFFCRFFTYDKGHIHQRDAPGHQILHDVRRINHSSWLLGDDRMDSSEQTHLHNQKRGEHIRAR